MHTLPGIGLHGRQYARSVIGGLREVVRAHWHLVGEHDQKFEQNVSLVQITPA